MNLTFEGGPLGTVFVTVEQRLRAGFEAEIFSVGVANAFPVVVADDAADGDVVLPHKLGNKLGGPGLGGGEGAVAVLTHFDANGVFVTGAFIVGVLALLVGGEALVDFSGVDAEVPGEIAKRVVLGFEAASFEDFGMSTRAGSRTVALGGVDGDVARGHRPHLVAPILAGGDHEGDVDSGGSGMIVASESTTTAA